MDQQFTFKCVSCDSFPPSDWHFAMCFGCYMAYIVLMQHTKTKSLCHTRFDGHLAYYYRQISFQVNIPICKWLQVSASWFTHSDKNFLPPTVPIITSYFATNTLMSVNSFRNAGELVYCCSRNYTINTHKIF